MAPVSEEWNELWTMGKWTNANLAISITVTLVVVLTFVTVYVLCICGGKKKGEKKEEAPRYLDIGGPAPTGEEKSGGAKKDAKSVMTSGLDPPPMVPWKSTVILSDRKTSQMGGPSKLAATAREAFKMASDKGGSKKPKASGADPTVVTVVVKGKGGFKAGPSGVAGGIPGNDFADEDDPRYRSLANLDEAFEGTQMKQSMRPKQETTRTGQSKMAKTALPPPASAKSTKPSSKK